MKTQNEVKHTPTPWKEEGSAITAHGGYAESWNKQIPATKHRTIVATINQHLENWDSNAAFIIHAVNGFEALQAENTKLKDSHEELVKAAKDALNLLLESVSYEENDKSTCNVVADLLHVLAKAEGK